MRRMGNGSWAETGSLGAGRGAGGETTEEEESSWGLWAGAGLGSVALLAVVGAVAVLSWHRRRGSADAETASGSGSFATPRDAGRRLREPAQGDQDDPSLDEPATDRSFWDRLARPSASSASEAAPPPTPNPPSPITPEPSTKPPSNNQSLP